MLTRMSNISSSSSLSLKCADDARAAVLAFFNAPPEYTVIFTANASGAFKLVGESYPFAGGSSYVLGSDSHNSVRWHFRASFDHQTVKCFAGAWHPRVCYVPWGKGLLYSINAHWRLRSVYGEGIFIREYHILTIDFLLEHPTAQSSQITRTSPEFVRANSSIEHIQQQKSAIHDRIRFLSRVPYPAGRRSSCANIHLLIVRIPCWCDGRIILQDVWFSDRRRSTGGQEKFSDQAQTTMVRWWQRGRSSSPGNSCYSCSRSSRTIRSQCFSHQSANDLISPKINYLLTGRHYQLSDITSSHGWTTILVRIPSLPPDATFLPPTFSYFFIITTTSRHKWSSCRSYSLTFTSTAGKEHRSPSGHGFDGISDISSGKSFVVNRDAFLSSHSLMETWFLTPLSNILRQNNSSPFVRVVCATLERLRHS